MSQGTKMAELKDRLDNCKQPFLTDAELRELQAWMTSVADYCSQERDSSVALVCRMNAESYQHMLNARKGN